MTTSGCTALCIRVSIADKGETVENQRALHEAAKRLGLDSMLCSMSRRESGITATKFSASRTPRCGSRFRGVRRHF
jgi:hypothetical protein